MLGEMLGEMKQLFRVEGNAKPTRIGPERKGTLKSLLIAQQLQNRAEYSMIVLRIEIDSGSDEFVLRFWTWKHWKVSSDVPLNR